MFLVAHFLHRLFRRDCVAGFRRKDADRSAPCHQYIDEGRVRAGAPCTQSANQDTRGGGTRTGMDQGTSFFAMKHFTSCWHCQGGCGIVKVVIPVANWAIPLVTWAIDLDIPPANQALSLHTRHFLHQAGVSLSTWTISLVQHGLACANVAFRLANRSCKTGGTLATHSLFPLILFAQSLHSLSLPLSSETLHDFGCPSAGAPLRRREVDDMYCTLLSQYDPLAAPCEITPVADWIRAESKEHCFNDP